MSAGSADLITAKKVRTDARKSLNECMASDIILILPEIIPTINLNTIVTEFEIIDNAAAYFLFCDIHKMSPLTHHYIIVPFLEKAI